MGFAIGVVLVLAVVIGLTAVRLQRRSRFDSLGNQDGVPGARHSTDEGLGGGSSPLS